MARGSFRGVVTVCAGGRGVASPSSRLEWQMGAGPVAWPQPQRGPVQCSRGHSPRISRARWSACRCCGLRRAARRCRDRKGAPLCCGHRASSPRVDRERRAGRRGWCSTNGRRSRESRSLACASSRGRGFVPINASCDAGSHGGAPPGGQPARDRGSGAVGEGKPGEGGLVWGSGVREELIGKHAPLSGFPKLTRPEDD